MSGMYISGLASGIDTDALVTKLIQLESQGAARLDSQKQDLKLKADAWKDVRTRLVNLLHSATDLTGGALYNQKTALSGDSKLVNVTATSAAVTGNYQLEILTLAKAHCVAGARAADITGDEESGVEGALGLAGNLIVNDISFEITENDSLRDISRKINESGGAEVKAAVIDGRLVLTRTRTGSSEIKFGESDLSEELGFLKPEATIQAASDARFKVNGLEITRSGNLIDDVLPGLTFNLLRETDSPVTITVQDDYSQITAKVQNFVDQYNSTYQFIKSKIGLDLATGIKGPLYGESSLNQVLSTVRRAVTGMVEGAGTFNNLSAIGITTVRWDSEEPEGTLLLDKDKLLNVLKLNTQAVAGLLSAEQGATGKLESYLGNLTRYGEGLIDLRGKGIQDRIKELDRQTENLKRLLEKKEQTLRNQFLAAEKVIGQMNAQSQWLEQQLGSMRDWQAANYRR